MISNDPPDPERKDGKRSANALRRVKVAVDAIQGMSIDQLLEELRDDLDEDFEDDETETFVGLTQPKESEIDSKRGTLSKGETTRKYSGQDEAQTIDLPAASNPVRFRRATEKMGKSLALVLSTGVRLTAVLQRIPQALQEGFLIAHKLLHGRYLIRR